MTQKILIENTTAFVQETLKGAEGGHDWFHIERVFRTSKQIAKGENVDELIVALGALLHDIADAKFNNGDESVGPKIAKDFLAEQDVAPEIIQHVVAIINNISFKNSLSADTQNKFSSKELEVIQDADRLDALGAIGIARAFNYGGFKNRVLYDPSIEPCLHLSKEEYKKSNSPTINHFYEKLLLLKDRMNTKTGKKMAEERHRFMLVYLEEFYKEWNGGI